MDLKVANWFFNTFGSNKAVLNIAKVITHFGDAVSIILIIALLLIFKKSRKIGFYSAIAVLLVFCFNNLILKLIIERERPFIQNPELISAIELVGYKKPTGFSMASGHATASMCLAISVLMFNKKAGIGAVATSVLIGLTRIVLCVHFLTDVLVGFAIGAAFSIGVHYLVRFILEKYLKRKGKNVWKQ